MALFKCPECKQKISTQAAACPHCGAPVDASEVAAQQARDTRTKWAAWIAFAAIAVPVVIGLTLGETENQTPIESSRSATVRGPATGQVEQDTTRPESDADSKYDTHSAWAYMQQFVERRLAPRPADFRFGGFRDVEALGEDRYRVDSYVDTENDFGGKIRIDFDGVIERVDGGWRLERLDFSQH